MNSLDYVRLNKESILERITETDIFNKYFGEFKLYTSYCNPLRKDDNPSSKFFVTDEGNILYHDFSTGSTCDCFGFIMKKYKISYWESLKKIKEDFNLDLSNQYVPATIKKEVTLLKKKESPLIQVVERNWEQYDIDYWIQYGITTDILNKFNVIPVVRVYLNKKNIMRNTSKNPIYAFRIKDKLKIYRPLADKKNKWLGNIPQKYYHNLDNLDFVGDVCFITSSLKDLMCLYSLGYNNVISPQSESVTYPKHLIDTLKFSFNRVVIFYDNDTTGIECAKKMSEKYNLEFIYTPEDTKKDISDYYKEYGKKMCTRLIDELLDTKS